MLKVRRLVAESGLTHRELGMKMGYPEGSARQSISQFLKGKNPTIRVLTRFAKAMGVKLDSLL